MDSEKKLQKLKNLKKLFADFVVVANKIKALCDSTDNTNVRNAPIDVNLEGTACDDYSVTDKVINNGLDVDFSLSGNSKVPYDLCNVTDGHNRPFDVNLAGTACDDYSVTNKVINVPHDFSNVTDGHNIPVYVNLAGTACDDYSVTNNEINNGLDVDIFSLSGNFKVPHDTTASLNGINAIDAEFTRENVYESNSKLILIEVPHDTTASLNGTSATDAEITGEINIGSIVNFSSGDNVPQDTTASLNGTSATDAEITGELNIGSIVNFSSGDNTCTMLRFVLDGVNETMTDQQNSPDESYSCNIFPDNYQPSSSANYLINDKSIETNDVLRCSDDEQMNILSNDKTAVQQNKEPIFKLHFQKSLSCFDESNSMLNVCVKKGSCDNSQMTVETSGGAGKRLCCLYCRKRFSKLARHLATVHKEEEEVKNFLALPKKSKERRNIQDSLRKRGTFEWNTNASLNNGILCTSRRPNGKVLKKPYGYKICPKCVGIYAPSCFSNHFNTQCGKGLLKGTRSLLVLSRIVEGRVHAKANNRLTTKIFAKIQDEDIVRLVRYDWLIIAYGNDLCTRYKNVSQLGMIRNKIKIAGRIFAAVKAECEFVTDFASAFRPKCFNSMLGAIKTEIGKFDPVTEECGSCSPVLAAVTEIRKLSRILKAELSKLEEEGSDQLKNVEKFITLIDSQETNTMCKTVRDTQRERKRLTPDIIPSTDDVKCLASYVESERIKYFNQLSEEYSYSVWLELTKIMAASIIVFNRKRTGETQWILLTEFIARKSIDKDCKLPIYSALSEQEKKVARSYSKMVIRGKRANDVQVLLNRNMEKSIELLLKHREDAGVTNEFLFGLPSKTEDVKVINSCAVLLDMSKKCNADDPTSLRGTFLRKHVASYCITLNLDDAAVGEVAKHMGHSEKVHHYYYRRNNIDRDIVRMSKRLLGAQGISEDIHDETDDTDLEDDVNNENDSVAIIHDNTEELTCQLNDVKSSMKKKPGRKRKKAEELRGESDGIPDEKRPKKKMRSDHKSGQQKRNTKTLQVQRNQKKNTKTLQVQRNVK